MNEVIARAPESTQGPKRRQRILLLFGALGLAAVGAACHGPPHAPPPPPAPFITSVSPTAGPTAGGTSVTINGTNFSGVNRVRFGAADAASFTVNSSTMITATSPAGSGVVGITVNRGSTRSANNGLNDDFEYAPVPTITGLSPVFGSESGGTSGGISAPG